MDILDGILLALGSAGKALSAGEIARRIVAQGWSATSEEETRGKVSDLLRSDAEQYGEHSLFVERKPGAFGLRAWEMGWGLAPAA